MELSTPVNDEHGPDQRIAWGLSLTALLIGILWSIWMAL